MYTRKVGDGDPRGKRLATWDIDLLDDEANRLHWNEISRAYKFLLQWGRPIPVNVEYVLRVVFSSPFTDRLDTQRVLVSGQ